jgi:hypothetical protein
MSSLKFFFALASTYLITDSMTPDNVATTASDLLQSCEAQHTVAAAGFNYASCITEVAIRLDHNLDPDNLNDVMAFYRDNMVLYTEIINSQSELAALNAEGGIVAFLHGMSKTGLAVLIAKLAAAVGLGFIANKAVKGLMLVTNYLIGAVKQPVVATEQVEQAELVATQELKRATDELSKIRRTANTVAKAARILMKPISKKRAAALSKQRAAALSKQRSDKTANTVAIAAHKLMTPIFSARLASEQLDNLLGLDSSSVSSHQRIYKFKLPSGKSVGGRKTKNKRNSRNKRNRRNSRRK